MPEMKIDLLVIGGGSGGVRAARVAASHGARVVLVEEHRLGGTCVIRGCVPKKLMVLASRFRAEFEDASGYGWKLDGHAFDWGRLKHAIDQEVHRLEKVYESTLTRAGVEIIQDRAVFEGPRTVRLVGSGRQLQAQHILVATGAVPAEPDDYPGSRWVSNSNQLFEWDTQPRRVLVQGAGYIALEFACILQRLGSEVTVVMRGAKILRGFDEDVRSHLQSALIESGVRIVPEARLASVERREKEGALSARLSNGMQFEIDAVLGATGRRPNTAFLGLDKAGVQLDERGAVVVTGHSCTNVDGIYAIGDVSNAVALTPIAIREGHAFADRVFGGKEALRPFVCVPTAVFTTPEAGTVGLSEEAALIGAPDEIDIYISRFRPMKATLSGRDEKMLMKLVVHRPTGRLLGAHMVGPDAAEMIQLVAVAMQAGARKADLDATLAVHPSAAEEYVTMREPARQHSLTGRSNPWPAICAGRWPARRQRR